MPNLKDRFFDERARSIQWSNRIWFLTLPKDHLYGKKELWEFLQLILKKIRIYFVDTHFRGRIGLKAAAIFAFRIDRCECVLLIAAK